MGLGSDDECQHYVITILLAIKQITILYIITILLSYYYIDKAGDKVLLSDNYQVNLTEQYVREMDSRF